MVITRWQWTGRWVWSDISAGDGVLCWRLPVTTEPGTDEHAEISAIRPHPEDRSGTGYLGGSRGGISLVAAAPFHGPPRACTPC